MLKLIRNSAVAMGVFPGWWKQVLEEGTAGETTTKSRQNVPWIVSSGVHDKSRLIKKCVPWISHAHSLCKFWHGVDRSRITSLTTFSRDCISCSLLVSQAYIYCVQNSAHISVISCSICWSIPKYGHQMRENSACHTVYSWPHELCKPT